MDHSLNGFWSVLVNRNINNRGARIFLDRITRLYRICPGNSADSLCYDPWSLLSKSYQV